MSLNKWDSEYASGPKYANEYGKVLHLAVFLIRHSVFNMPESLDRVLNISWILNIPGF